MPPAHRPSSMCWGGAGCLQGQKTITRWDAPFFGGKNAKCGNLPFTLEGSLNEPLEPTPKGQVPECL